MLHSWHLTKQTISPNPSLPILSPTVMVNLFFNYINTVCVEIRGHLILFPLCRNEELNTRTRTIHQLLQILQHCLYHVLDFQVIAIQLGSPASLVMFNGSSAFWYPENVSVK